MTTHFQNVKSALDGGFFKSNLELEKKIAKFITQSASANAKPTIRVVTRQLTSFGEIVEVGGFNNSYYQYLQDDEICRTAIFAPIASTEKEDLYLYWEGENQVIPDDKDFYKYFKSKGFEVVEKAHPSLLVGAMAVLTEEKLEKIGIPSYVDVVLPTSEDSLLPRECDGLCFLEANRNDGYRKLYMIEFRGEWDKDYAFLVRKIKKQQ